MIGIGILFDNKKRLPLNVAVAMAKREFAAAVHTRGETARAVVFHPDQAPEEAVIGGLTVYTDRDVPLGRIRVCTGVDPLPSPPPHRGREEEREEERIEEAKDGLVKTAG